MEKKYDIETNYKYNKSICSNKILIIKTLIKNLNLKCVKPERAGVIIYTVYNNRTYFGLGFDANTHDLTDFGGRVLRTDKNVIEGALREFEEETLGIFEKINYDDVETCPVIYDNHNLIIFIRMDIDPDETSKAFSIKYNEYIKAHKKRNKKTGKDPEVCGITWLTWDQFQNCIKNKGILFYRVEKFLARANDFSYLL